jgi:hypothetical protein
MVERGKPNIGSGRGTRLRALAQRPAPLPILASAAHRDGATISPIREVRTIRC